ncbi:MAG: DASS family sodium-coupled anion symporter [Phycisphaerales bacterium]|nr:MAG: DASS family sodium-coupled anion symporter [Phycisphaerales bacterium]
MPSPLSRDSFIGRMARLALGPILALMAYAILGTSAPDLAEPARRAIAVTVLVAVWWMTEAIGVEAVGLVPLALLPLAGVLEFKKVCVSYANPIVFLFLGGMLLGRALERSGLHRRVAMLVLRLVGASPARLILGFLVASAAVSMVVSNTACAVMMLPIAASVGGTIAGESSSDPTIRHTSSSSTLPAALALAVAYGSSIGGVGTIIGTPPIAQLAAYSNAELGVTIEFAEWLKVGFPFVLVALPVAWIVLALVTPGTRGEVPSSTPLAVSHESAPWSTRERLVAGVFVLAILGWVTSRLTGLADPLVAVIAGVLLFIIPSSGWSSSGPRRPVFLLEWHEAERVPWGVLLLFGGGLALADGLGSTGADAFLAKGAGGLAGLPPVLILMAVALATIFLGEMASNTALTAIMLPIAHAAAPVLGINPMAAVVTVALASSLSFMLPAGTPPNALAFSTGRVRMSQMVKAGVLLNLVSGTVVPIGVVLLDQAGWLPS